ncbi:MAG: cytochrome c family protein [Archangium sp.]
MLALSSCTTPSTTSNTTPPAPSAPAAPREVTFFFSAEVRGYLGPCGCSENMRGSISRAAFQVAEARKAGGAVHFVDCGDGLFGEAEIPPVAQPQQERKAKALSDAWKAMGLDVRAPGPLDDARGAEFHQSLALPELASGTFKVIDRVALVSAPSIKDAAALVPEARKAGGRFIVALVPTNYGQALREVIDPPTGIDLVISSKSKDAFAAEESKLAGGTTRVAQIQSKGRSLLKLTVTFEGDDAVTWLKGDADRDREVAALDQRIELLRVQVNEPMLNDELKALRKTKLEEVISRREALASSPVEMPKGKSVAQARFIPLETTFPKDPKVLALEQAYDADVGLMNLAYAKEKGVSCAKATPTVPGIVGTATCVTCHAEAESVYVKTKHPLAWKALEAVGKQNHLDCIGCHVTGWQKPDGVCRLDVIAGRQDVGCESCHGPGSLHVAAPSKVKLPKLVEAKTCIGCHDRENSPTFDFDTYVEKVKGPGHGR